MVNETKSLFKKARNAATKKVVPIALTTVLGISSFLMTPAIASAHSGDYQNDNHHRDGYDDRYDRQQREEYDRQQRLFREEAALRVDVLSFANNHNWKKSTARTEVDNYARNLYGYNNSDDNNYNSSAPLFLGNRGIDGLVTNENNDVVALFSTNGILSTMTEQQVDNAADSLRNCSRSSYLDSYKESLWNAEDAFNTLSDHPRLKSKLDSFNYYRDNTDNANIYVGSDLFNNVIRGQVRNHDLRADVAFTRLGYYSGYEVSDTTKFLNGFKKHDEDYQRKHSGKYDQPVRHNRPGSSDHNYPQYNRH